MSKDTVCEAYAAIHGVFLRLHSGDAAYSLQTGMAAMKQASISMPDRPETHPSFVFRCSVGLKGSERGVERAPTALSTPLQPL